MNVCRAAPAFNHQNWDAERFANSDQNFASAFCQGCNKYCLEICCIAQVLGSNLDHKSNCISRLLGSLDFNVKALGQ